MVVVCIKFKASPLGKRNNSNRTSSIAVIYRLGYFGHVETTIIVHRGIGRNKNCL